MFLFSFLSLENNAQWAPACSSFREELAPKRNAYKPVMGNVPEKGRSAHQGEAGAQWSAARRDVLHRSGAWRGCELRNRLFSVKDKISCEK